MTRTAGSDPLRHPAFPYLVIAAALALTPVASAVVRSGADDPSTCEGIGFGCTPGPGFWGWITQWAYMLGLGAALLLVGLLHLGGRRFALVRSWFALASVGVTWVFVLLLALDL